MLGACIASSVIYFLSSVIYSLIDASTDTTISNTQHSLPKSLLMKVKDNFVVSNNWLG